MCAITKVAIIGAAGNFGTPTTAAIQAAGFDLTIITREDSPSVFPPNIPVIRTAYTLSALTLALEDQDAVVCMIGPGGMHLQATIVEAAHEAGVERFILSDFGWGNGERGLDEFKAIQGGRRAGWEKAVELAENGGFAWTSVMSGNPIDWALRKFPLMGFDVEKKKAIIYDEGREYFTGTTLEGIAQAVVGVIQHPAETFNKFVPVLNIKTNQSELLEAFQEATGTQWEIKHSTTEALLKKGREQLAAGDRGWVLSLVVAQLLDKGQARCVNAESWEESDSGLLGVKKMSAREIVDKVLASEA